jgi:hypothetical protein
VSEDETTSWIEVVAKDGRIWAKVVMDSGKTNSTQHVSTKREVEDLAAAYGISRTDIRYTDVDLP